MPLVAMSVALLLTVLTFMSLAVGAALLPLFAGAGAALHCFRQAAAAFGDLPPHDDGTDCEIPPHAGIDLI